MQQKTASVIFVLVEIVSTTDAFVFLNRSKNLFADKVIYLSLNTYMYPVVFYNEYFKIFKPEV